MCKKIAEEGHKAGEYHSSDKSGDGSHDEGAALTPAVLDIAGLNYLHLIEIALQTFHKIEI